MANTLKFKRGLVATIPTAALGEPLFTTDTFDLYIGNGTGNTRFQKYIASGATTQILRGDGSLYTFPLAISSPSAGQVLKYNGTSWVNDSDAGITGSGSAGQVAYFTGATTQGGSNNLFWDATNNRLGVGTNAPFSGYRITVNGNIATYGTDPFIIVENGGVGGASAVLGAVGTSYGYVNTIGAFPLLLRTNSVERARITSGGNFIINNASTDNGLRFQVTGDGYFSGSVGIGTSSPQSKLVVLNSSGTAIPSLGSNGGHFQLQNGTYGLLSGVTTAGNAWMQVQRTDGTATAYDLILQPSGGNLGLGVVPSAWGTSGIIAKALQVNNVSFASTDSYGMQLSSNAYWDGSSWRYIASSVNATNYFQGGGVHGWRTAATGTAGNAITFTQAMTLDASGNLFIGATSGSNTAGFTNRLYLESNVPSITLSNTGTNTGKYTIGVSNGNFGVWNNGTSSYPLYIFSDNNIGIGTTTNAGYKLDVNGTMRVSGASTFGSDIYLSAANRAIIFNSSANLNTQLWEFSGSLRFVTGGNTQLTIASTGAATFSGLLILNQPNTGVNTYHQLNRNAITTENMFLWNTNGVAKWYLGQRSFNSEDGFSLYSTAAATNVLYFTPTGAATFSSSVTATAGTFSGILQVRSTASTPSIWSGSFGGAISILGDNVTSNRYIDLSIVDSTGALATQGIRLINSGNVLIGTTTDAGYKLDVNGTMRVSGATTFNSSDVRSQGYRIYKNGSDSVVTSFYQESISGTVYGNSMQMGASGDIQFWNYNGGWNKQLSIGITGAATFSSSVTCSSLTVDSTTLVVDATNNRLGVNTNAPTSSLHVVGSVTKSHTTKTANYTMTESDYTVLCDTSAGGFTISLPAASGCSGRIYVVKKITGNSGTNNITIDPNGSETIDGSTTYTLQCRSSVMIQSNGANWWILAERVDNSCI